MDQKEYWNSVSETKTFTLPFNGEYFSKYVRKNSVIVDVGCGYGRVLKILQEEGYENLTGFDFSPMMIERARRESPLIHFETMEEGKIPLEDESADAVILFAVLTCIVSDEKQEALIEEIHRILKPNGIMYVNDYLLNPNERNQERYRKYEKELGVYGAFILPEGAICRHHTEEHITELFSNFETEEYEHIVYTTMNGHQSPGFTYIGKKILKNNS
ncbi:MAG: class I SAM-dependent methyltransferase [Erysipelotrichaceae bacterium]|nr:class I SAM-dependent methyltransferase [Erysipelotrichaceae bacterium]